MLTELSTLQKDRGVRHSNPALVKWNVTEKKNAFFKKFVKTRKTPDFARGFL
jgi:hypothetical protein